jgi:hypothetical protein
LDEDEVSDDEGYANEYVDIHADEDDDEEDEDEEEEGNLEGQA